MDSFKPDIDGREADFATSTSSKPRLVAMPNIPAMDRTLDEILGGDPEVASLHMGICELHADMRHPENMMDKVEDFLRTAATSGVGEAAVAGFNGTLRKVLLMRHAIQVDPKAKTKTVYPPALDGGDSRRWRKDLLEMYCLRACRVATSLARTAGGLRSLRQVAFGLLSGAAYGRPRPLQPPQRRRH